MLVFNVFPIGRTTLYQFVLDHGESGSQLIDAGWGQRFWCCLFAVGLVNAARNQPLTGAADQSSIRSLE